MSLRSMTGYGHGAASAGGVKVEVELSSVNRRQLDVSVSLPRSFSVFEPRIEEEIHKRVSRGRVTGEVSVSVSSKARQQGVRVDEELARTYLEAMRRTAKRVGLKEDFGASTLLSLPDVVRYEQTAESAERVWPLLSRALNLALENMLKMRDREGAALQKDVARRLDGLVSALNRVRKQAPTVVESYRKKLMARLRDAGFVMGSSDERLLRELALFADKSDITEEITRLESHIQQAHKLMQSKEPVGRSLDFLAQEMFREMNTMGSKANDGDILRNVVAMKAELERIREQVQNIE